MEFTVKDIHLFGLGVWLMLTCQEKADRELYESLVYSLLMQWQCSIKSKELESV